MRRLAWPGIPDAMERRLHHMRRKAGSRTLPDASFNPLVSIVIPVYNGANFMRSAIDSALAQTYANCEVIVVNDGSRDDGATAEIARGYGDRIRYIEKQNGGCGSALNAGIAAMRGDYFSWLSHDDVYLPDKIGHQISVLASLEERNTILFGPYELIDGKDNPVGSVRPHDLASIEELCRPLFAVSRGLIHGCTLLIPRKRFQSSGPFDASLACTQDYDLWLRMFPGSIVRYDPRVLIRSRIHPDQSSKTVDTAVEEGEALWKRFVTDVSPRLAAATDGNHYRYLANLAAFLEATPYRAVAPFAREAAESALAAVRVAVVVPYRDRIAWTVEAVVSVLAQSHGNFELLLVDDGSKEDDGPLQTLAATDDRVRCFSRPGEGAAAARNFGVRQATADYVAFLDSDDAFAPEKLSHQLRAMVAGDLVFCHTAYEVFGADIPASKVETSYFSGKVYPTIIATCPIATPTVMLRRDIALKHPFPAGIATGEDVIAWIGIARECRLGALDEPLTRVRLSAQSAGVDRQRYCAGLANILAACLNHPTDSGQGRELRQLVDALWLNLDPTRPGTAETNAQRDARTSVTRALALARRGFASLIRLGPATTWRRARAWYVRRRLLRNL